MSSVNATDGGVSDGRVVVGVDGSAESVAALRFAHEDAGRRDVGLLVVAAFESPEAWSLSYEVPVSNSVEDVREHVLRRTRQVVAETLGVPAQAGLPPVEVIARLGRPAHVLVSASAGSPLLVVGSRGLGGFRRMLLGSVSMQCVQHALCPVTVVRLVQAGQGGPDSTQKSRRERQGPEVSGAPTALF